MTLDDLEIKMRLEGALAVNIHLIDGLFRVHMRQSASTGFSCAQRGHETLASALAEHFPAESDLSDLLV